MTNEEFQNIVLEELKKINHKIDSLEAGQKELETGQRKLEAGQKELETGQRKLEAGQRKLETGQRKLEAGQRELETGQRKLEAGQRELEKRQKELEVGQRKLEKGQREIKKDLEAVVEQTVDLTEFRQETDEKLNTLKSIHEILGEHEVSIRTLKRKVI